MSATVCQASFPGHVEHLSVPADQQDSLIMQHQDPRKLEGHVLTLRSADDPASGWVRLGKLLVNLAMLFYD